MPSMPVLDGHAPKNDVPGSCVPEGVLEGGVPEGVLEDGVPEGRFYHFRPARLGSTESTTFSADIDLRDHWILLSSYHGKVAVVVSTGECMLIYMYVTNLRMEH
ncbi:hypothetical protein EAI_15206 [Harpegnathos saltator]|uniref:Uncharacterized protein n=1 Tax=Harpegnathos saltator TaxID=610380 RepID=E2BCT8_HARSA|nr:hypothetical protein EAI_15206 [Harpegnathos saltator]